MQPPHPNDFEVETRPQGGDGRYQMAIPYGWEGAPGIPYGGWTAAVALRAASAEAERDRPASLAAQFLRPLSLDAPLDIDVELLRRGRRTETLRVTVGQNGKAGVHVMVTTTDDVPGLEFGPEVAADPPEPEGMPALGDVIRSQGGDLPDGHHIDHYEYVVPENRDTEGGIDANGRQALVGWIRFGEDVAYDDPYVEAARYLIPADTQVPAAFLRGGMLGARDSRLMRGTTLDLLVHFHRTERSTPWIWYETHVQIAHAGLASGVCNLWSADRRLLATSFSQVAFLTWEG